MRHDEVSEQWKRLARFERWLARSRWRVLAAVCGGGLAVAFGLAPARVNQLAPPGAGLVAGDHLRIERRDAATGVLAACDEVTVDPAGRVIVLGRRVAAAGHTPEELATQLTSFYAGRSAERPLIFVRASRPVTITIAGPADVCLPGPRAIPAGTRLSRVCEVLHPGRRLDASRVELVHGNRTRPYDLLEIASGAASEDPVLEDGDLLKLTARDARPPGFWVLGAVARPGRRPLADGLTVSAALDEVPASGQEPTVHLVRGWPEHPRIHRLSPADEAIPDMPLEPDDLLLVSGAPSGLLGERPALAALVMSLAAEEPVVLAAAPGD